MPVRPPIYQSRLPVFGGGGVTQVAPEPPDQDKPINIIGEIFRGILSAQERKRQQELEQKRFGLDKMLAEAQAQYYLGRAAQPLSPSQKIDQMRYEGLLKMARGDELNPGEREALNLDRYKDVQTLLGMVQMYTRIVEAAYLSGMSDEQMRKLLQFGQHLFGRLNELAGPAEKPPGTPIEEALKGAGALKDAGALTTAPEKPVPPATTETGEPLSWKQNIPPDEQLALLASYSQKDKDKAVEYLAEFAKKNPEKILEFYPNWNWWHFRRSCN